MWGNRSMKKSICLYILVFFIVTILVVFYGLSNIKHINYEDYIENSSYSFISSKSESNSYYAGMDYESMYDLDGFFIDDKIKSLEDLELYSDYIFIVEMNDNPEFVGNGILNNCIVKKIVKGNNIEINQKIKIYDLIAYWDKNSTLFFGGSTPLDKGKSYVVFVNKAKKANTPNSYVFSNVKYSHVSVSQEGKILDNYDQNTLKIKDIIKYDFVFESGVDNLNIENYKKIYNEIYKKYRK